MKASKKVMALVLALSVAAGFSACGSDAPEAPDDIENVSVQSDRPTVPESKRSIEHYFDFTFTERYDERVDRAFSMTLPEEKDSPVILYDRFSYDTDAFKEFVSGEKYLSISDNDGLTAYDSNKFLYMAEDGSYLVVKTDYYDLDDREYISCIRTNVEGAETDRGVKVGSSEEELLDAYYGDYDFYYLTKEQTERYPVEKEPDFAFDYAFTWQPFTPETNDIRDITYYISDGKVSVIEIMSPYELRYVYGGRTLVADGYPDDM